MGEEIGACSCSVPGIGRYLDGRSCELLLRYLMWMVHLVTIGLTGVRGFRMDSIVNFSLDFSNSESNCCDLHPIALEAAHWFDMPHHLWRKVMPNGMLMELSLIRDINLQTCVSTLQLLKTELKTVLPKEALERIPERDRGDAGKSQQRVQSHYHL